VGEAFSHEFFFEIDRLMAVTSGLQQNTLTTVPLAPGALTNSPKFFIFQLIVLSHTLLFLEARPCSSALRGSSLELLAYDIGGDTVSTGTMKFKLHVERPVGS
jgi:hypothetical protein